MNAIETSMTRDMNNILMRFFTVLMLIFFSMGAKADAGHRENGRKHPLQRRFRAICRHLSFLSINTLVNMPLTASSCCQQAFEQVINIC